jgi:hypothetical protein
VIAVLLAQPLTGAEGRIETPQQLVTSFYETLLAEVLTSEVPEIFSESATIASALKLPSLEGVQDNVQATKDVWQYFRANKNLFLFNGVEPSQTLKKCRLNYCFVAFSNPSTFFDGIFCVELTAPLSTGGKEGVYKQIRLPLKKNDAPTGPRYLIQVSMITVNGVMIDPSREFDRKGNLYQQLGFFTSSKLEKGSGIND